MKKSMLLTLLFIAASVASFSASAADKTTGKTIGTMQTAAKTVSGVGQKIAVVDMEDILAQSPAGKQLTAMQKSCQEKMTTMQKSLTDIGDNLQKNAVTMSNDQKQKLQKEAEQKHQALASLLTDCQKKMQDGQGKLRQVMVNIQDASQAVASSQGYAMVLPRSSLLALVDQKVDITKQVTQKMHGMTTSSKKTHDKKSDDKMSDAHKK